MSEQEQVSVPEPVVEEDQKKAEKKQKNLEQLAIAREKAAQKKKEKKIEAEQTKAKLAELEARLTKQALAKVEADTSSEDEETKHEKHVVTKVKETEPVSDDNGPSLLNEIKKTFLLGGLGIASFLVAQRYSQKPAVIPHSPMPAKRPAPTQSDFIAPQPTKRRVVPPVPLFSETTNTKTPVGASGFFQ